MCCRKKTDLNYNNMQDKVSEKAIWEGSIPSENENTQFSSFQQSQPQMMFCYKCNNVIPGNSKYCPCCKVELFTTCPKCGAKYSSQYHICNQCGTDRDEYLRLQKIERERKDAIERENQRQREIQERKIQEEEQRRKKEQEEKKYQEALERQRRNDYFKKEREKYERKKEQIMNTEEYQSTYSVLKKALESYRRRYIMIIVLLIASFVLFWIILDDWGIMNERVGIATGIAVAGLVLLPSFGLVFGITLSVMRLGDVEKREQYIWQYIGKKDYDYDKDILEYVVKKFRNFALSIYDILEHLSEWCIEAYRNKKRKK